MNARLTAILSEIKSLSEQRGWSEANSFAAGLMSSDDKILLAAPKDVDTKSFERWVSAVTGAAVTTCALESLAQDPLPAVAAGKVIALFECGRLIEADAVEAVGSALFNRPAGSYAIVLDRAEHIESDEELETLERGVWRLLVPEPKSPWSQQNLLEKSCYLWSAAEPGDLLKSRLRRDGDALALWLRDQSQAEEIDRYSILYLIDLAQRFLAPNSSNRAESRPVKSDAMMKARDRLFEIRQRLLRRLDEDKISIERQLTISLQTLEQDLLQGLRPFLQQHVSRASSFSEKQSEQVLSKYMKQEAEAWKSKAEQLLLSRNEAAISDAADLFQTVDWSLINEVASRYGEGRLYPDALLENIVVNRFNVPRNMEQGAEHGKAEPNSPVAKNFIQAVMGSALVVATASWIGYLPAGAVAVGLGTMFLSQHRKQTLDDYVTDGRARIRSKFRNADEHVKELIDKTSMRLREHVSAELRLLEEMLDRAIKESRRSAQDAGAGDTGEELLRQYQAEVLSMS